jgi:tetratricopeptide (TPR) repeat protein
MLVSKQMHLHWEVLKWVAIISLAVATAIILTAKLASAADRSPIITPALLPVEVLESATPIVRELDVPSQTYHEDLAMNVWQTLESHRQSNWELAIIMWAGITLPGESQVWRHVCVAQAHLQMAELDEAEAELGLARAIHPENALVRYFTGILRLEQAAMSEEWYEPQGQPDVVFVSQIPVVPNTRSMFKLAAINELQAAITHGEDIHAGTLLVPPESSTEAALLPTVGDLLAAVEATRFQGKAHNMLSALYLENGQAEAAEQHLDAAYDAGITIVFGYTDLGELYQARGKHSDAARAFAKAIARQPGAARSAIRTLENVRDALHPIW